MFRKSFGPDSRIVGIPSIIATDKEGPSARMAADVLARGVTESNQGVRRSNNGLAYYQLIIADPTQAIENTPVD